MSFNGNNVKNLKLILIIAASSTVLSGCATITGNSSQPVSVQAYDTHQTPLTGVKCKLTNDKGTWYTNAPDSVMVQKSAGDLHVVCEKPGLEPGLAKVVSKVNAGMFGNIIVGGGVGAIIDHTKGTAYNYPSVLNVVMGENKVFPEVNRTRRNKSL